MSRPLLCPSLISMGGGGLKQRSRSLLLATESGRKADGKGVSIAQVGEGWNSTEAEWGVLGGGYLHSLLERDARG